MVPLVWSTNDSSLSADGLCFQDQALKASTTRQLSTYRGDVASRDCRLVTRESCFLFVELFFADNLYICYFPEFVALLVISFVVFFRFYAFCGYSAGVAVIRGHSSLLAAPTDCRRLDRLIRYDKAFERSKPEIMTFVFMVQQTVLFLDALFWPKCLDPGLVDVIDSAEDC